MEIRPVGTALIHAKGGAAMFYVKGGFCNYATAPKNCKICRPVSALGPFIEGDKVSIVFGRLVVTNMTASLQFLE
jgi:hypothetical protein